MDSEQPSIEEEKPVVSPRFTQPDLRVPLFPEEEGEKLFPKKILEMPKTIHHSSLPNIPFFDH